MINLNGSNRRSSWRSSTVVIAVLRIRTSRERRSGGPKYRIHGLFSAALYTPYKRVSQLLTDRSFFPQSYQRFPVASDTRICLMRSCLSNFQLSPLHNIAKENVNLLSQQSWMEEVLQEKEIRSIITNSRIMKKIYTQLFLVHFLASPLLLSLHQIDPDQFVPQHELLYGSSFRPEYNFLLISHYNSP